MNRLIVDTLIFILWHMEFKPKFKGIADVENTRLDLLSKLNTVDKDEDDSFNGDSL